MARQWNVPGAWESMVWNEDGEKEIMVVDFALSEDQAAAAAAELPGKLLLINQAVQRAATI